MRLGKLIVMGLLGISVVVQVAYTGYYAAGGKSVRTGKSVAVAEFLGACVNAFCLAALYLNW